MLGAPVAAGAKQRFADDRVSISAVIGEVADRDVIVLDDEIAKGSTVLELIDRLRELGPRSIRVACTHGLFAAGALERLGEQPDVLEIVCTEHRAGAGGGAHRKLRILSVAPALAEAVRRIHNGESVSALFDAPRGDGRGGAVRRAGRCRRGRSAAWGGGRDGGNMGWRRTGEGRHSGVMR